MLRSSGQPGWGQLGSVVDALMAALTVLQNGHFSAAPTDGCVKVAAEFQLPRGQGRKHAKGVRVNVGVPPGVSLPTCDVVKDCNALEIVWGSNSYSQAVRFARLVLSKVEEQMSATLQESVAGETINQEDVTAAVKSTSRARRQVAKILFSQFPRQSARAAIQQALEQARRIPTSTTTSAQEWRLVAGRQVSPSWSESCGMVEMVKESLPRELAKDFFAEVKKVGVAFATHALLDAVAVAAANSSLTSDGLSQVPDLGNIECGPNYVTYFLRPPSGWSQICEQRLIAYENDLAAANCSIALNTPLACNTFRRICGHIWAGTGNSRAFSDHIRGFSGMVIPACMFVTGEEADFQPLSHIGDTLLVR